MTYFQFVKENITLKDEETKKLIQEYKEGNETCKEKIVEGNIKLVISIVNKLKINRNLYEDAFQMGVIGLMKAIENFDFTKEVKFSTYATYIIQGSVKRYIYENNIIKIGRDLTYNLFKIKKIQENFLITHKKEANIKELSEILNLQEKEVKEALQLDNNLISIDETLNNDDTNKKITVENTLIDPKNNIEFWMENEQIREAINTLEKKEQHVIHKKYFEEKTQNIIGKELGLSQAQVSRLEKTALKKLKCVL